MRGAGEVRVHASVVIAERGQILLVREGKEESRGLLNLPGGHVEFGETVAAAAAREVREEVGVGVYLTDLVGIYTGRIRDDVVSVRFVFGGHVMAGDPAPSGDVLEVLRMTTEEARALPDESVVAPSLLHRILGDIEGGIRWPLAVLWEGEP